MRPVIARVRSRVVPPAPYVTETNVGRSGSSSEIERHSTSSPSAATTLARVTTSGSVGPAPGPGDASPAWHEPWAVDGFRDAVQQVLLDVVDEHDAWLDGLGEDAVRLLDAARTSLTGGKRLRAAFCYWAFHAVPDRAGGGASADALLRACASLEVLHASALVHDDLMDLSDTRRGRPATHRAFADLHQRSGWTGDPEQYGASAAVLLGDLLLAWSDELLSGSGLPPERVLAARPWFDRCRTEVVAGQFLDVSAQARGRADVDVAMRVLRYKSAKYSVERPLHVGAALAGAGPDVVEALSRFGLPLGEAFQLRDDLLGVFGDPAVTGKPAGDDLVEGKRTVLVALALDALPGPDARHLDATLGTALAPDEVAGLAALVESSGARAQVEQVIDQLTERALAGLDALRSLGADPQALTVLRDLADAATRRSL
ncbi:hypothetical protein LUZ63_020674 [Rhynchospora breviuscula]|uniref:Uncharacterized protein n=1 Tax=Rhynchospora breviuscula TaxID=2022672 RepID=A0A9Q0BZE1_9POAL|nr:hypothetical protein LUZ63_020674 [Rhynchospora breviuscula]